MGSAGVAERLLAGVVAEQEGPLVLEDGEPGVVKQGSGLAMGGDDAAEAVVRAGRRVHEPPGGRPGDPFIVPDGLVQVAEAFGDVAGGLDVDQLVDAVAGAAKW